MEQMLEARFRVAEETDGRVGGPAVKNILQRGLDTWRTLNLSPRPKCLFANATEWAENRPEEHFPLQFEGRG